MPSWEQGDWRDETLCKWRWKKKGDGCIVRLVAMLDPSGRLRIETGKGT
jgi:hypothetical protein